MSLYLKIILIVFALAYLVSPVDIIPDILLPYVGWIDDGLVLATIIYMLKRGRLPDFVFKKKNPDLFHKTRASDGTQAGEKMKSKSPLSPYQILGVEPSASKKEIQQAYKSAIKKYHPDKLSHLGEEFSNLANEKFLEIQNAYDTLMKKF